MIDVTDRADVDVRLTAIKFFFRHVRPFSFVWIGTGRQAILQGRRLREHDCRRRFMNLEPLTGIEPVTSSLPRTRSTI